MENPLLQSITEIEPSKWLIGGKLLLACHLSAPTSSVICKWGTADGRFYSISNAPDPLISSQPLSQSNPFELVYDAGGVSAVWEMGDAFLKIKILDPGATREHVTLAALNDKKEKLSFSIPRVLYHGEWDGRYYIVLTKMSGQTLHEAWPQMDEDRKQYCVTRITEICAELAQMTSDRVAGIDGNLLDDNFLTKRGEPKDFSHTSLRLNCEDLGMDCSEFVFNHCDLGPGNILIDLTAAADGTPGNALGIIDWETAGFVPREWVRTKFFISSGLDFENNDFDARVDWRRRVTNSLGSAGWAEIAKFWSEWRVTK